MATAFDDSALDPQFYIFYRGVADDVLYNSYTYPLEFTWSEIDLILQSFDMVRIEHPELLHLYTKLLLKLVDILGDELGKDVVTTTTKVTLNSQELYQITLALLVCIKTTKLRRAKDLIISMSAAAKENVIK